MKDAEITANVIKNHENIYFKLGKNEIYQREKISKIFENEINQMILEIKKILFNKKMREECENHFNNVIMNKKL